MKFIMNVVGYEVDGNTECVIPDGVVEIKERTFFKCKDVTSLIIPKSVNIIGNSAFRECPNLESIIIQSENIQIDALAFAECERLKNLFFEKNGKLEMEACVFSQCKLLEEIILPKNLTNIPHHSFYKCTSLSNIIFPDNLKEIHYMAFMHCENLKEVILPNGVKEIRNSVFAHCTNLISLTLPNSIKHIASDAFFACDNIQNVNVSSYRVYNLLDGEVKFVATKSIVKNYYNKTVEYTEDEIQDLKDYIRKNRIVMFSYAMGDHDLYRFMFYDIDRLYSQDDINKLFNIINDESQFGEWARISKTEANGFLLQYIHDNNLHIKSDELILDDLDDNLKDEDTKDDGKKGNQKKLTN